VISITLPSDARSHHWGVKPPVRTVLVVDHDPAFHSSLEGALGPLGYRILTADSVEAACALLSATRVDAVLFESNPPMMSGIAFYDAVVSGWRSLERHIAFMSEDGEARGVRLWLKRHQCAVFRKPYSWDRVLKWIDTAARPG
jgi:DNA-binding NtrC family response regulator